MLFLSIFHMERESSANLLESCMAYFPTFIPAIPGSSAQSSTYCPLRFPIPIAFGI